MRTDADFPVFAPHGSEILTEARTVLVPASHEQDERLATEPLPADLRAALDTARDAGARLASVCTGAFVLAAYGALDGRRATTHWLSADRLARAHPRVEVDADVLYVDEGEVLTSAGEAAGIDLCLHLIRRDHGAATAADVARRTVVPPHREGGQAQYIRRPVPEPGTASTAASRAWALDHLADPLTLADLAAQATMSIRTYTRHFRRETGQTPYAGSPNAASTAPASTWRKPTTPSTTSPARAASARMSRCGTTSMRHWGLRRGIIGRRFGGEGYLASTAAYATRSAGISYSISHLMAMGRLPLCSV